MEWKQIWSQLVGHTGLELANSGSEHSVESNTLFSKNTLKQLCLILLFSLSSCLAWYYWILLTMNRENLGRGRKDDVIYHFSPFPTNNIVIFLEIKHSGNRGWHPWRLEIWKKFRILFSSSLFLGNLPYKNLENNMGFIKNYYWGIKLVIFKSLLKGLLASKFSILHTEAC